MSNPVPPHDPTAEASLAVAVLLGQYSVVDLCDIAPPEAFFGLVSRRVVEAAKDLDSVGDRVDVTTVAGRLRATDKLDTIGGVKAISELVDSAPAIANHREYATTVANLYQRRRIIAACRIIETEAHGAIDDHRAWLSSVEMRTLQAASGNALDSEVVSVQDALVELTAELMARKAGQSPAIAWSGISSVDAKLRGGFRGGLVYVVAGRPGMGKTALMTKCAVETARKGNQSILFELEMPTNPEMATRMVSLVSRIPHDVIDSEKPDDEVFRIVSNVQSKLDKSPLAIIDRSGLTVSRIRAISRQVFARAKRHGINPGLIAIDYLGLVRSQAEKGATRERQVSFCSVAIKEIAKELGVPILLGAQLNRELEGRTVKDHRPRLSDLRESGSIEQDADVVIFPYRESVYDESLKADTEDAEIIFAKFRGGKPGVVHAKWRGANMEYLAEEPEFEEAIDDLDEGIMG